jgi:hypothetical protein
MTIRDIEYSMIMDVYFDGCVMGELGNQRLLIEGYAADAKGYFEKKGVKHTSFDLNGKDGSIPVDLSKPIGKQYHNKFDIVTNAGTSEHITNGQIEVFRNIHDMCKIGGYMIHSIPKEGCWKDHCPHKYTWNFIRSLAKSNGYTIKYDEVVKRKGKDYLCCGILEKTQKEFIIEQRWLNEIIDQKNYKINTDNYK